MTRAIGANTLLGSHGIRGGLPNSHRIMVSLLQKPPEYIKKDPQRKQWHSSWVYGAPVTVSLPNRMPTPQSCETESANKQEGRTAVISGDEDMGGKGQKAEDGSGLDIWYGSGLEENDPFDL